jgi:hypothetical protein
MYQFMTGAIAMGFAVATLFFLRFWKDTGDRLFALFALALFIMALNRVGLGILAQQPPHGDKLYWVRFLAFALILVAILDKNRIPKRPSS